MDAPKYNVTSQSLLITGVTGFIGFKTLLVALERGYAVRAIIQKLMHVNKSENYERDIISPAISMVTTVLEAAANVSSVRRIVITSSCVTLIPFEWNLNPDSERLYSSSDINPSPNKPYGSAMEAYWALKAYSRMATRNFVKEKKPHFDFVHLLPCVVFGPDERIPSNGAAEELLADGRAAVIAPALDGSTNSSFPFVGVPVHVADVARAHVDAVDSTLIPGNTEYILSSDTPEGIVGDRDTAAVARKYFPEEVQSKVLPREGALPCMKLRLDGDATEQAFGWEFISFEQTMRDLLAQ